MEKAHILLLPLELTVQFLHSQPFPANSVATLCFQLVVGLRMEVGRAKGGIRALAT